MITPVVHGEVVRVLFENGGEAEGIVLSALSSQFTADVQGYTRFFFYRDRGVTWQKVK